VVVGAVAGCTRHRANHHTTNKRSAAGAEQSKRRAAPVPCTPASQGDQNSGWFL